MPYRPKPKQTKAVAAEKAMDRARTCGVRFRNGHTSETNLELALKSAVKLNGFEAVWVETGLNRTLIQRLIDA